MYELDCAVCAGEFLLPAEFRHHGLKKRGYQHPVFRTSDVFDNKDGQGFLLWTAESNQSERIFVFLPLLLIMSVNLWYGVDLSHTPGQVLFHVITMVNVGFIEEIIFRGMLFRMMEKDNVKSAILVSALTFGIGHIINLLNGADLIPTLLQVCYAVSIGFLFVIIFYKSKSLVPCIVTHGVFNSLSVFHGEGETVSYISAGFLIAAPLVYTVYIARKKDI